MNGFGMTSALCLPVLAASLFLLGCEDAPPGTSIVSGKTVYKGMGVEEVSVEAFSGEELRAATSSTYHGDFILNLPEGEYRLEGSSILPGTRIRVHGVLSPVVVEGKQARIDRLVIELREKN